MKKIIYILTAASLALVSCSRTELETLVDKPVWNGESAALSLGVRSSESVLTKAEDDDEEETYNENKIYTLDYFIFDVDPSASDNSATEPVTKGRLTFDGIEPVTEDIAKENAQIVDLKEYFNDAKNKCWVYVIANLPAKEDNPKSYFEIDEDGEIVYYVVSEGGEEGEEVVDVTIVPNWEGLQAIKFVTDFKNSLQDGKFKAQKSFVMTGLSDEITLTGKGADYVIVDVSRMASKVTLNTNVVKMVDKFVYNTVTGEMDYIDSYFPNVDEIQIYLNYVNPGARNDGQIDIYNSTFFSYNRYAYIPEIDSDGSFTSKTVKRDDEGHIELDGNGDPVYEEGDPFPAFAVTGTPFYAYPSEWDSRDATAPFIKIIIPWIKYEIPWGIREQYTTIDKASQSVELDPTNETYQAVIEAVLGNNFPNVESIPYVVEGATVNILRKTKASDISSRFGEEFYYKIALPSEEYKLLANNWYQINLDISVLGSETDDAAMVIDGSKMGIMVCDWGNPREPMGGDLDGGRYLSTAQNEYTINAVNSITIPVISSHTLAARVTSAQRYINGAWANISRSTTIEPSGTNKVTFTNVLNNTMGSSLDCYPLKFTIDISQVNSDGSTTGTLHSYVTVIQYPPIYVDSKPGGNVMIDGYYGNVDGHYHGTETGNNPGGNSGTGTGNNDITQTPYAPISRYVTTQRNMTVISISSLGTNTSFTIPGDEGGTFDYIITDPRQPSGYSGSDLTAHYNGQYNQTNQGQRLVAWTNDQASKIMLGTTSHRDYIAPKIMISSRWGRMGYWQPAASVSDDERLEIVQKRCATYQEAGYPAGRWRLPTEAEIMFIADLQIYDFIDDLFTSSGYSISSTGGVFTVGNSVSYNANRGTSCRCVYDLWYWGEEPVSGAESTYTIAVE